MIHTHIHECIRFDLKWVHKCREIEEDPPLPPQKNKQGSPLGPYQKQMIE